MLIRGLLFASLGQACVVYQCPEVELLLGVYWSYSPYFFLFAPMATYLVFLEGPSWKAKLAGMAFFASLSALIMVFRGLTSDPCADYTESYRALVKILQWGGAVAAALVLVYLVYRQFGGEPRPWRNVFLRFVFLALIGACVWLMDHYYLGLEFKDCERQQIEEER